MEIDDRGFERIDGRPYIELSENGWGAVIAAVAEPHRVRRGALAIADYTTTIVHERDGRKSSESKPRSEDDQRSIDDDIDEYLAAAGLPPRPRGFRWFIEVPPGVPNADEFWRRIVGRFGKLTSSAPGQRRDTRGAHGDHPRGCGTPLRFDEARLRLRRGAAGPR